MGLEKNSHSWARGVMEVLPFAKALHTGHCGRPGGPIGPIPRGKPYKFIPCQMGDTSFLKSLVVHSQWYCHCSHHRVCANSFSSAFPANPQSLRLRRRRGRSPVCGIWGTLMPKYSITVTPLPMETQMLVPQRSMTLIW